MCVISVILVVLFHTAGSTINLYIILYFIHYIIINETFKCKNICYLFILTVIYTLLKTTNYYHDMQSVAWRMATTTPNPCHCMQYIKTFFVMSFGVGAGAGFPCW